MDDVVITPEQPEGKRQGTRGSVSWSKKFAYPALGLGLLGSFQAVNEVSKYLYTRTEGQINERDIGRVAEDLKESIIENKKASADNKKEILAAIHEVKEDNAKAFENLRIMIREDKQAQWRIDSAQDEKIQAIALKATRAFRQTN